MYENTGECACMYGDTSECVGMHVYFYEYACMSQI